MSIIMLVAVIALACFIIKFMATIPVQQPMFRVISLIIYALMILFLLYIVFNGYVYIGR